MAGFCFFLSGLAVFFISSWRCLERPGLASRPLGWTPQGLAEISTPPCISACLCLCVRSSIRLAMALFGQRGVLRSIPQGRPCWRERQAPLLTGLTRPPPWYPGRGPLFRQSSPHAGASPLTAKFQAGGPSTNRMGGVTDLWWPLGDGPGFQLFCLSVRACAPLSSASSPAGRHRRLRAGGKTNDDRNSLMAVDYCFPFSMVQLSDSRPLCTKNDARVGRKPRESQHPLQDLTPDRHLIPPLLS